MTEEKLKQRTLNKQLSEIRAKLSIAQFDLENMIEKFGMSSPQVVEASQRFTKFAMRYSELEDELFLLQNHAWRYIKPPS